MKVTISNLDLAKTARDTLLRIHTATAEATKQLAKLQDTTDKTARVLVAIEQIQVAMKTADVAQKIVKRLGLTALCLAGESAVELGDNELAALAYGMVEQ